MKIKIIIFLLITCSLKAMKEDQPLIVPQSITMPSITHQLIKVNATVDGVMLDDNKAFVVANLARATGECACGTCLSCVALTYSCTNPFASLATLFISLSCLASSVRTGLYAESLTEIPDKSSDKCSDQCAHAIGNSLRIACCIKPRVPHKADPIGETNGYEEL